MIKWFVVILAASMMIELHANAQTTHVSVSEIDGNIILQVKMPKECYLSILNGSTNACGDASQVAKRSVRSLLNDTKIPLKEGSSRTGIKEFDRNNRGVKKS